jgi:hypothetical protein
MEDKILTKWQLGMALQSKINEGLSASEIGKWAFGFYFSDFEWDDMISDVLSILNAMEIGPDFEYSEKELRSLTKFLINYDSLKDDKQFFLDNTVFFILEYASDRIKNDREVILNAVKNNGKILRFASDELKNDREIVLIAVKNWGLSLQYGSKNLRADKEVVLAAMKENSLAFKYADESLKTDKDILLAKNMRDILSEG